MKSVSSLISDLTRRLSSMRPTAAGPARPVRVVIAGHDLKFMGPYIEYFTNSTRYELRIDEHPGHEIASERQSRECLRWADVLFCEWAMGNLVWYSRHKRKDQLLLVRLHLQEWQHRDRISYLYDTRWDHVNHLLLTSHHIYEHITAELPVLRGGKAQVLYCPIDAKGAFNREKQPDAWRRLGIVGIVPQRKRLDLAITILDALQREDPHYTLHIKSRRPEEYPWMQDRPDELVWYNEIYRRIDALPNPDGVVFEPHGDDMPDWFSKIGFLLSTSDFEGSHQSVAESMATGCIPVIRDWEGANRIYPPRFVWSDTQQAIQQLLRYQYEALRQETSSFSRQYAQEQFDQGNLCRQVDAMIMRGFCQSRTIVINETQRRAARTFQPTLLMLGYLAPGYRGGYRVRIEQEIRALVMWGVRVHFACLHPKAEKPALADHGRELEQLGCTPHLIRADAFFAIDLDAKGAVRELDALEKIVTDQQIDLVHSQALYSMRMGLLLRERLPNLTLVFDSHGVTPEEERMGGAAEGRAQAMEAWERRALNEASLNTFVSEAMGAHYADKYGWNGENRLILPCCVAEAQFAECTANTTATIPEGRIVIAYTGTLAPWQCGEEMIRLFAALHRQDADLFFLFIMPEKEHAQAYAWMEQYGLDKADAAITALPHGEVAPTLRRAHAGVLLRREDPVNQVSSPTKFAEYLAAGLPVLLSDHIGDYSQLARYHEVGLVLSQDVLSEHEPAPETTASVRAFLHGCVRDKETLAQRCQRVAREQLHWDTNARELMKRYEQLLLR